MGTHQGRAVDKMTEAQAEKYVVVRTGRNVFATPPRISVVIPVYNGAEFIAESIESVIAQKYREHEIIVVNDGSPDTDKIEEAIKNRMDDIVYIRQRNAGAGVARNTGIEHARGRYIAFLDGDDVWLPDYLSSQYIFLERHNYDMVYCDAILFGLNSAYRRTFMETAPSDGEANFESILDLRCNVITSGTLVRKRAVIDAGMFETERVRAHDFVLWLRIARSGSRIGYQRKVLLKYRVHVDSLSGDSISRVERERDAFVRVQGLFDLDPGEIKIVERRIAGLEADLAVERGKSLLLGGSYREASHQFRMANTHRRSVKLTAVAIGCRIAPSVLLRFYRSARSADIALVPTPR